MMRFRDYVPEFLVSYVKLLRLRERYPRCQIYSHLISKNVSLGDGVLICRDVELAPNVAIGDYSYVNAGTIVGSGTIGKFCSIGYFCQIGMPEHPVDFLSTSPRTYGRENIFGIPPHWEDYPSPPIIENDVWIGSQALILQNVRIQNGAIVAGGSVVTKDVAPYTIVAGVPAKPIRQRLDPNTVEILLRAPWWDLSLEELRRWQSVFELGDNLGSTLPEMVKRK